MGEEDNRKGVKWMGQDDKYDGVIYFLTDVVKGSE